MYFLCQNLMSAFMAWGLRPENTLRWLDEKANGSNGSLKAPHLTAKIICIEIALWHQFNGRLYSIWRVGVSADFMNILKLDPRSHFLDAASKRTHIMRNEWISAAVHLLLDFRAHFLKHRRRAESKLLRSATSSLNRANKWQPFEKYFHWYCKSADYGYFLELFVSFKNRIF